MDAFNYLSVLLSIILGLAITQILKGVRGIALARSRVIPYWPTFVLAVLLFFMNVQSWWAMFGLREVRVWTFPMFAVVLLQTTSQYLLAALVLPDFFGEETVDLRAHYYAHHRLFFSVFVAMLLISLAKSFVTEGHLPESEADIGFHIGFIAIALAAALTKREWFHKLACVLSSFAFFFYIALLFARLH
jgi:hypothetical protein